MKGNMKRIISRDMMMVIGIALLASMPTFAMAIHNGHDLQVHLMRIEGLVTEGTCVRHDQKTLHGCWHNTVCGIGYVPMVLASR